MSLTNQIRESRRSMEGLPFELSMETMEADFKAVRTQDKAETDIYNKAVAEWAKHRRADLRSSISTKVRNNESLSKSLKEKVYYNRKGGKEVQRVGFSFNREGIYIHKGAGRGHGGVIGGSWIDRQGRRKTRSPQSAGKMGTGNRQEIEWFDPIVDRTLPQLADIVSEYSATLQLNATELHVNK